MKRTPALPTLWLHWEPVAIIAIILLAPIAYTLADKHSHREERKRQQQRCTAAFALAKTAHDSLWIMNGNEACHG